MVPWIRSIGVMGCQVNHLARQMFPGHVKYIITGQSADFKY